MEPRTMELPVPKQVKEISQLEELAEKTRAIQSIIKEYEDNLNTTAELQCEIVTELEKGNIDISLLKAVKAVALTTKNMSFYRECLVLIIPRLKESLGMIELVAKESKLDEFTQAVEKYRHYIMLAEQELSDLERM